MDLNIKRILYNMHLNKKAQGLPINTIILIAIGLLILVLFIVFVLGGFNGLAGGTSSSASSLQAFYSQCSTYCATAQSSGSAYPTDWCTTTTVINNEVYHCYNQSEGTQIIAGVTYPAYAKCALTVNGQIQTYGQTVGDAPC